MRLGINIPNFGPETTPQALLDWARFAQEHGLAIAMMSDHVAPTPEVEELYPAPFFDPFTTLAWLAGQTKDILLGTTVTVLPYRHPLLTARISANIDQLSQGRFVLGVGVGWAESEYAALGVSFGSRGKTTSEYLEVITTFWDDRLASFEGATISFRDVSTGPAPANAEGLPIWVGGASPAGIDRAARYADAWHPNNPDIGWLEASGIPAINKASAAFGRRTPDLAPRIKFQPGESDARSDRPLGVGSPAQILTDLRRLEQVGCTCVVLDPNPDQPVERDYVQERAALAAVIDAFR